MESSTLNKSSHQLESDTESNMDNPHKIAELLREVAMKLKLPI